MRKIADIYEEYNIVPTLAEHMFRVAAVASLICDNFDEPLPKEDIVTACLLHDMGNIIKFKFYVMPEVFMPEGLEYWRGVQDQYIKKYGNDEHVAAIKIAKEVGVNERVIELINSISFLGAPLQVINEDFSKKIVEYSDKRVEPKGLVSLEKRLMDLRKRYAEHGGDTPERRAFEKAVHSIEEQIFAKCKIKPEDITDITVAPIISKLKDFVIPGSEF